MKILRFKKSP